MADPQPSEGQNQNPPNQNPPAPEPSPDEVKFWDKLSKTVDEAIEKKIEKYRGTGNSRTGGRTTLPDMIANLMFGPAKKD